MREGVRVEMVLVTKAAIWGQMRGVRVEQRIMAMEGGGGGGGGGGDVMVSGLVGGMSLGFLGRWRWRRGGFYIHFLGIRTLFELRVPRFLVMGHITILQGYKRCKLKVLT